MRTMFGILGVSVVSAMGFAAIHGILFISVADIVKGIQ